MNNQTFEVEVISRQRSFYRVEARDTGTAEKLAAARWQRGDPSDLPGVDWVELIAMRSTPAPDPEDQAQDDEVILRFVQERERLLVQLGGEFLTASMNDAISAAQAAADLGWVRNALDGSKNVDAVRAAQALERLCEDKRLVCFQRTRVRAGERGEIRLYCTPRYLDGLSAALNPEPRRNEVTKRSAVP